MYPDDELMFENFYGLCRFISKKHPIGEITSNTFQTKTADVNLQERKFIHENFPIEIPLKEDDISQISYMVS